MSGSAVLPGWLADGPVDVREVVCVHCLQVLGASESYAGDAVLFAAHLVVCPEYDD